MSNPIDNEQEECMDELATWVRVLLLDELIYNNGKTLDSNLIGEITKSVVDKLKDKF